MNKSKIFAHPHHHTWRTFSVFHTSLNMCLQGSSPPPSSTHDAAPSRSGLGGGGAAGGPGSNFDPCPWERDDDLYMEVANHGAHHLGLKLFRDERDHDLMLIAFKSLREVRLYQLVCTSHVNVLVLEKGVDINRRS